MPISISVVLFLIYLKLIIYFFPLLIFNTAIFTFLFIFISTFCISFLLSDVMLYYDFFFIPVLQTTISNVILSSVIDRHSLFFFNFMMFVFPSSFAIFAIEFIIVSLINFFGSSISSSLLLVVLFLYYQKSI